MRLGLFFNAVQGAGALWAGGDLGDDEQGGGSAGQKGGPCRAPPQKGSPALQQQKVPMEN